MAKRRTESGLVRLRKGITNLDDDSVDRLYGLEPVWEPDRRNPGAVAHEEFVAFACPWCGERLETRIDLSSPDTGYVEDCQVCCRPIEFGIERDAGGALVAVRVSRLD